MTVNRGEVERRMMERNVESSVHIEQDPPINATHALWRSFAVFKATLPDRAFASTSMRPTSYTIPVGLTKSGYAVEIRVEEVSSRRDLWMINCFEQDRPVWCERTGTFVKYVFDEDWTTTFDPTIFNCLPVIMARLPQAIEATRKSWQIEPVTVKAKFPPKSTKGKKVTS